MSLLTKQLFAIAEVPHGREFPGPGVSPLQYEPMATTSHLQLGSQVLAPWASARLHSEEGMGPLMQPLPHWLAAGGGKGDKGGGNGDGGDSNGGGGDGDGGGGDSGGGPGGGGEGDGGADEDVINGIN